MSAHPRQHLRSISSSHPLLKQAVDRHQAGALNEAQGLYRKILRSNPENAEALHLLGVTRAQAGSLREALELMDRALTLDPDHIPCRFNHAETHHRLGCQALQEAALHQARVSFQAAIASNPGHEEALLNLGAVQYRLGCLDEAEEVLEDLLERHPTEKRALHNLGLVRQQKGDILGSLRALWSVLRSDPDDGAAWASFAGAFQSVDFGDLDDPSEMLEVLMTLLAQDAVDPSALASQAVRLFRADPEMRSLVRAAGSRDHQVLDEALREPQNLRVLNRRVIRLALERTVLPDLDLEWLFQCLRRRALECVLDDSQDVPVELLVSLAKQCYLNGYVWGYEEEEVVGIETMVQNMGDRALGEEPNDPARIAILACYVPLLEWERAAEATTLASDLNHSALSKLVLQQVLEPCRELDLQEAIPVFRTIQDEVSLAVRRQYEEHPYPRWVSTFQRNPVPVSDIVQSARTFEPLPGLSSMTAPRILVAGCGTGKHLMTVAFRYRDATVTGLDLSLSSLGFAARKADELGFRNVKLMQADILDLPDWEERFHVVEAVGVLHHMQDPVEGWRILAGLLEPGGIMRLGLYSELARQSVVESREIIAREGFQPDPPGIRAARDTITKHFRNREDGPHHWRDFFSLEECRDLLFHVQEHRFTLPEIQKVLPGLGLEFVGFEMSSPQIKENFRSRFPESGAEASLEKWHQFEVENPDTFRGMYQFWVQKPV